MGRTIKVILNLLSEAGYRVIYKVLDSLEHGVPQMRKRVYFVGVSKEAVPSMDGFIWPEPETPPLLSDYLLMDSAATGERLEILRYYLNNPTNSGKYSLEDLLRLEGRILDTRMSDLRIYDGRCPTLRAQRDGILYVKNGTIYQLTGFEALLLQGFPKEYAAKVKEIVSDRHLLMQAGNAMTVPVIEKIGRALIAHMNNYERKTTMKIWEQFEIECLHHLNDTFKPHAEFVRQGGADSTLSDIIVQTAAGSRFYIEVKQCPAQCGQFVLLPDTKSNRFYYSARNKTALNEFSQAILDHINSRFDDYYSAGTKGVSIEFENSASIFSSWIIGRYKEKGARYFITNGFSIFPMKISRSISVSALRSEPRKAAPQILPRRNMPS